MPETNETEVPSEFGVHLVRILRFDEIPGADQIHVARFGVGDVEWDYPVVVRKDAFKTGDRAVYLPVDAVLPDEPEFSFLGSDKKRLRARRLRGVYSEGLLITAREASAVAARSAARDPANAEAIGDKDAAELTNAAEFALFEIPIGTDIRDTLGVTRWQPPAKGEPLGGGAGRRREPDETWAPRYAVLNAKKGEGLQLVPTDALMTVTEKIHGVNLRFGVVDGTFRLGSHNQTRVAPPEDQTQTLSPTKDPWGFVYLKRSLHTRLAFAGLTDLVVYGEIYGKGIQDLDYGLAYPEVRIYDAWDAKTRRWYTWHEVRTLADTLGLDTPPVVWQGPKAEMHLPTLAEGPSCVGGPMREGVVCRTTAGGPHGRWKYVSQAFRLRKTQVDNAQD